jgi:Na+-driven multidrug efflux pump
MQKQDRSAMLGTMKMTRLIPKISIPIMASMLIQALYNIVDSIFVSRFDPNGLTAVSLAFPFQMLMIALSTGMGTGINSLVSRRLGERQPREARQAAWNGLLVEGVGSLLFILFGLLLSGPVMRLSRPMATVSCSGCLPVFSPSQLMKAPPMHSATSRVSTAFSPMAQPRTSVPLFSV